MDKLEVSIEMYDYFYSKFYQGGMGMPRTKRNEKFVENFLKIVEKDGITVGVNWLFDYNAFMFNRMMTKRYGSIQVQFVYGQKAYDYWKNRPAGWSHFVIKEFLKSRGIIKERAIDLILYNYQKEGEDYSRSDEKIKQVHSRNFLMCIQLTSLWNPSSRWCRSCSNAKRCKAALRENNYQLYKKRDGVNRSIFERVIKSKRHK